jgi:protein-disulfide isomerase
MKSLFPDLCYQFSFLTNEVIQHSSHTGYQKEISMKRRSLIIGAAAATAGGGWALKRALSTDATPAPSDASDRIADYVSPIEEMVQGSDSAKVTLIEYASFTCSHCAAFHATAYQKLKSDYISTGKIKYVYRDVFFDRYGVWASMVARCGGKEKFFGIAELIYAEQGKWARAGSPADVANELRKLGRVAGLNAVELEACMQDKKHAEDLVGWYQHNAKVDNIVSTPSFVIGGKTYKNMSYEDMQELIDAELAA